MISTTFINIAFGKTVALQAIVVFQLIYQVPKHPIVFTTFVNAHEMKILLCFRKCMTKFSLWHLMVNAIKFVFS